MPKELEQMCGIAGFVNRDNAPAELMQIKAMTDAVAHRGPDGSGHFLHGTLALGHRRLSVLDLSEHGRQPMSLPDELLFLTYNGEIYNYVEIRSELRARGHVFRTETDSEVILAAYREWGKECVERFNGMWSFAVFDKEKNEIFVSRDRFGIKPFYYILSSKRFAFGSEIRQLLNFIENRKANQDVLTTFLLTNGSDMGEQTFFDEVYRLPGGFNGCYDVESGRFQTWKYYDICRHDFQKLPESEAIERFRALFDDAVRLRLRSDVKVGTCLSGGLDSSSVAAVASGIYHENANLNFSAITAVSEQESNNEERFARMVVDSGNFDWYPIKPNYQDFVESLPRIVNAQEEPFGSSSLTMQYFVMKTARENGITVLLDGQGGDETLLGYEKYYASYMASLIKNEGIGAGLIALRDISRNNANMGFTNMLKYLIGGSTAKGRYAVYRRQNPYFARFPSMPLHLAEFSKNRYDSFELQKLEINKTNLPILLRYEDKNSMAYGIEARLPFLDYRLLEFSLSLPNRYKIHEGWTKWILRKAMHHRLPSAVVWRKNKFGFESPEDLWNRMHRNEIERTIKSSQILAQIGEMAQLETTLKRIDKRSLWRLFSVALWERAFSVSLSQA